MRLPSLLLLALLLAPQLGLFAQSQGLEGAVAQLSLRATREPSGQLRLHPVLVAGNLDSLLRRLEADGQIHLRLTYSAENVAKPTSQPPILALRDRIVLFDIFNAVYALRDSPGSEMRILRSRAELELELFRFPPVHVSPQGLESGQRIRLEVLVEPAESDRGLWFLRPFRPREAVTSHTYTEVPE